MRFVGRAFVLAAFWVPLAICLAVAVTPDPIGVVASLSGVVAHICAFAYLTVALFQAHFRWPRRGLGPIGGPAVASRPRAAGNVGASGATGNHAAARAFPARCVAAAVLWMLAFGVAIEVAQIFVAGRSGDLTDLLPDAGGIALGCAMQSAWPYAARTMVIFASLTFAFLTVV